MKNLFINMQNPLPMYFFNKTYQGITLRIPMKTKEFNTAVKCAAACNKVLKAHKATMSSQLFRALIEVTIDSYDDGTKQKQRKFNLGYKVAAVTQYKGSTDSIYSYAKSLGVDFGTLQLWVSQWESGILNESHAVAFSSTRSGVLNKADVKVVSNA